MAIAEGWPDATIDQPAVFAQRRRREITSGELQPTLEERINGDVRGGSRSGGDLVNELG
jgi:hypothetical protein